MQIFRLLKITALSVCLFGFPILGFWAGWHTLKCKKAAEDCWSVDKFAQIRWLLLNYHDRHGVFPPTKYQPQANGPMHSWRVLVTMSPKNVDNRDRDSEYDFSQDWNSPKNLRAMGSMGNYFSANPTSTTDIANYLAIGEKDGWPSKRPLKSFLVTKGKDRFLVVEYPDSDIHWMEPRDASERQGVRVQNDVLPKSGR